MKLAQRDSLLKMAEQICQSEEYKIPESYFSSDPILIAVAHLMLMSFVVVQLAHLTVKHNKTPINLSEPEQKIAQFLVEKINYSTDPSALKKFLKAMRTQLDSQTRQFNVKRVPSKYAAKNRLAQLYDHLLRDSLILHPDFPALAAVTEIPTQPLESLLGFHFIEIDIKNTVAVNDALAPNFRTLLAIWQNPNAIKTPVTLSGMAAQHIDWTNPFSWTGVFSGLALTTPPSIKAFVNKNEYQGLVFSKELSDLLAPESKFKPDIERIKKTTTFLQQATENLQIRLLREHGLSTIIQSSEKKDSPTEEKELDLTLTFAESTLSDLSTQYSTTFAPAAQTLKEALDNYLKIATQHISLGTLARKINHWYEGAFIPTLETLLRATVTAPSHSTTSMTAASSASSSSSSTHTSSLTQSLSQTFIGQQKTQSDSNSTGATPSQTTAKTKLT